MICSTISVVSIFEERDDEALSKCCSSWVFNAQEQYIAHVKNKWIKNTCIVQIIRFWWWFQVSIRIKGQCSVYSYLIDPGYWITFKLAHTNVLILIKGLGREDSLKMYLCCIRGNLWGTITKRKIELVDLVLMETSSMFDEIFVSVFPWLFHCRVM